MLDSYTPPGPKRDPGSKRDRDGMAASGAPHACYICSPAHAGSTLLDMLLGGHSQIASLGEFAFFGRSLALREPCSCGAPVPDCAAWSRILERIKSGRGLDLLASPYALWQWDTRAYVRIDPDQQTRAYLAARKMRSAWCAARSALPPHAARHVPLPPSLRRGLDNTEFLYDVVRREWGARLVVDSSKNARQAVALHEQQEERLKIVFLLRDGRGVFHSHRTRGASQSASLAAWARYVRRMLPLVQRSVESRHLHMVRYEDLVADPRSSLSQLCAFLQLPFEEAMLDLTEGARHNIGGNDGSRFSRAGGIRKDERWKTQMPKEDLRYFETHGAELNRQLGYG